MSPGDERTGAPAARRPLDGDGPLGVAWLGQVPYAETLDLQHRLREARLAGEIGDLLLLLEHPPVYTRGRRATPDELPMGATWYADRGIEIVDVARGGKVTYHGPGQLVAYVIVRTPDVLALVAALERSMIAVAAAQGVAARGRHDEGIELTGAWVADRKLGSIGLHLSRGVTTHGIGLNVVTDLEPFGWIVPCGLTAPMTSIARERNEPDLGADPALDAGPRMRAVGAQLATAAAEALGVRTVDVDPAELRRIATRMPDPDDRREHAAPDGSPASTAR